MIYFAYDGSIHGDWVAQYAIGMAARAVDKRITLIHVLDGRLPSDQLSERINGIEKFCLKRKVELTSTILPLKKDVPASLIRALPSGADTLCICGTRTRSKLRGYLTGTVSEALLGAGRFRVMALRVVQPGLLGTPHRLLFPLSGNPRRLADALPFLRLLPGDIQEVHLMRVMTPGMFRIMSAGRARALHRRGREYLNAVQEELGREMGSVPFHLDGRVLISRDWPDEILIQASKLKSGLILMGSTERLLPARFFYGRNMERILRAAPCDVAIYRGA